MTLLETMMAVMILAVGISGAASIVVQSVKISDMAREHYQAVNLGKNRLERAKTLTFSDLESLMETGTVVDVDGNPDPDARFMRVTFVSSVATNLKEVVINVRFKDRFKLTFTNESEVVRSLFTEYLGQ